MSANGTPEDPVEVTRNSSDESEDDPDKTLTNVSMLRSGKSRTAQPGASQSRKTDRSNDIVVECYDGHITVARELLEKRYVLLVI